MLTLAAQLYDYVREGIRKSNNGTLTPAEFNLRYNSAQLKLVRAAYKAVDKDQELMDMLRVLTPDPLVVANSGTQVNEGERFDLPYVPNPPAGISQGYLHLLSVGLEIASLVNNVVTITPCTHASGWAPARPMSRDSRHVHDRNPYQRPSVRSPYYYMVEGYMRTRTESGFFVNRARIEYLRYPVEVSTPQFGNTVDPELPSEVNQRVCELVIKEYLEAVQSPRVRTHDALS